MGANAEALGIQPDNATHVPRVSVQLLWITEDYFDEGTKSLPLTVIKSAYSKMTGGA